MPRPHPPSPSRSRLAREPNEQTIHFDIHDEEDDDDEDEIVFQPSRLSSYDGSATSPTTQRNPYMNLKDIADQEVGYADETDNLALYQNDIAQRPRVARILGRLVRFGAKGEEEDQFNAEASMLALLRKRVRSQPNHVPILSLKSSLSMLLHALSLFFGRGDCNKSTHASKCTLKYAIVFFSLTLCVPLLRFSFSFACVWYNSKQSLER